MAVGQHELYVAHCDAANADYREHERRASERFNGHHLALLLLLVHPAFSALQQSRVQRAHARGVSKG